MPNPCAIIEHAIAQAELERLERKHRSELHRKLDAILARLAEIERRVPKPIFLELGQVDNTGTITWTKCSEALPDDDEIVLLAFTDGEVWTGFRDADDWRYLSADLIEGGVTHWSHLPAHPDDAEASK